MVPRHAREGQRDDALICDPTQSRYSDRRCCLLRAVRVIEAQKCVDLNRTRRKCLAVRHYDSSGKKTRVTVVGDVPATEDGLTIVT